MERSQETWKLFGQGLRAPQQFQQTLVQQAQQRNRTALSLLRTQKEWNDMRYYGLVSYLRQKIPLPAIMAGPQTLAASSPFRSVSTDSSNTDTSSTSTTTAVSGSTLPPPSPNATATPAKVAFMVTGRMKGQLAELGYTAEEIKSMTPVEASLVIGQNIEPADKDDKLPLLVQEYEEQQAKAHEQAAVAAAEAAAKQQVSAENEPSADAHADGAAAAETFAPPPRSRRGGPSWSERLLGSMASENVIDKPTAISSRSHMPSFSSAREWYEVVEEYPDYGGSQEVVALHSTEEEAQVDANLRLEIMGKRAEEQKKKVNVEYSIRKAIR